MTLDPNRADAPPKALSRDEAWALIPWLVNGTLSTAEAAQVRAYCEKCDAFQRELAEQTRLHAAIAAQDTVDDGLERAWSRMQAALPAQGTATSPTIMTPSARAVRRRTRWIAASGLVAAAAIALVVGAQLTPDSVAPSAPPPQSPRATAERDPAFVTVTTPARGGVTLRLQAAVDADDAALHALFTDSDLVVIDGPNADRVYTLRAETRAAADAAADAMTASQLVALVIVGGGP